MHGRKDTPVASEPREQTLFCGSVISTAPLVTETWTVREPPLPSPIGMLIWATPPKTPGRLSSHFPSAESDMFDSDQPTKLSGLPVPRW